VFRDGIIKSRYFELVSHNNLATSKNI